MSTPEDDDPPRRVVGSRLAERLFDRARRPLRRATSGQAPPPAPRPPAPAPSPEPAIRPTPPAPKPPVPAPVDRRPPRVPDPPSTERSVGRVRLTPATASAPPAPRPSAARIREQRAAERPGARPGGLPRRNFDDYMQMLGELRVAEARYHRSLQDSGPQVTRRRTDESADEGG